jgi:hypothetical protein
MCIPDTAEISKYPLYVGWVPTRNIYSSLKRIETGVNERLSHLETTIESLGAKIDALIQVVNRRSSEVK